MFGCAGDAPYFACSSTSGMYVRVCVCSSWVGDRATAAGSIYVGEKTKTRDCAPLSQYACNPDAVLLWMAVQVYHSQRDKSSVLIVDRSKRPHVSVWFRSRKKQKCNSGVGQRHQINVSVEKIGKSM